MATGEPSKRCRVSRASTRRASSASAAAIMRAGISSRPISSNSSGMRLPSDHLRVSLGNTDGKGADAGDDADTLGYGNGSAGIQQIEQVRALEAEVVGRQNRKTPPFGQAEILRLLRGTAQQLLALRLVEAQV